jgi:hypothetical protein
LAQIPAYFGIKGPNRLEELRLLFSLGLRETCDAVLGGQVSTYSYEEVERVVEARFEKT